MNPQKHDKQLKYYQQEHRKLNHTQMLPMFGEHHEMRLERKKQEYYKLDNSVIIEEIDDQDRNELLNHSDMYIYKKDQKYQQQIILDTQNSVVLPKINQLKSQSKHRRKFGQKIVSQSKKKQSILSTQTQSLNTQELKKLGFQVKKKSQCSNQKSQKCKDKLSQLSKNSFFYDRSTNKKQLKKTQADFSIYNSDLFKKKNDTENDLNLEDQENIIDRSIDYEYFKQKCQNIEVNQMIFLTFGCVIYNNHYRAFVY